jgi:hypothetical protein
MKKGTQAMTINWNPQPMPNQFGNGFSLNGLTTGIKWTMPAPQWIITDDQQARLNALLREIAVTNNVYVSISMDAETMNVHISAKGDEDGTEE